MVINGGLTSGKLLHNYGKSQFLLETSSISMAIFNSKLLNYQRVNGWGSKNMWHPRVTMVV